MFRVFFFHSPYHNATVCNTKPLHQTDDLLVHCVKSLLCQTMLVSNCHPGRVMHVRFMQMAHAPDGYGWNGMFMRLCLYLTITIVHNIHR